MFRDIRACRILASANFARRLSPDTASSTKSSLTLISSIGSGNPLILPPGTPKDRVQILQEAMRKIFNDPEFHREYLKLTGLRAELQMPEELEQTIRDMPRDREAVELFKKLTGPRPAAAEVSTKTRGCIAGEGINAPD